jgi:hypothetical protein
LTGTHYSGYLEDIRITIGQAVYAGNFTPPAASFDTCPCVSDPDCEEVKLLIQSDTSNEADPILDASCNNHTISAVGDVHHETDEKKFGSSSLHFNGSTDQLTVPSSDDWNLGSGDFTIETWAYHTRVTSDLDQIFAIDNSNVHSAANYSLGMGTLSNETIQAYFSNGASTISIYSSTTISLNTWYHVAMVRDGNTLRLFIDGIEDGTADITGVTNNYDSSMTLNIGSRNATGVTPNNDWQGYLEDIRITKGQAVYTGNFTPPAASFDTCPCPTPTLTP